MARRRRYIRSNRMYEIVFRAREGLPLPTLEIVRAIILSALARTQRDEKVVICHYMWMGNHPHIGCIALDPEAFVAFYQELQKKLTESLKKLLGRDHLHLWEGEPMVAEILDIEAAIGRIAYWYANPANANLVETVEEYPGVSTWQDFVDAEDSVDAVSQHVVPWIRLCALRQLPSNKLSRQQDMFIANKLRHSAKQSHILSIYPNRWMKIFGVDTKKGVRYWNQRMLSLLDQKQNLVRSERIAKGKGVLGAHRLKEQPLIKSHIPKKRERRIYVLSTIAQLRIDFIAEMEALCKICIEYYRRWKAGDRSINWPPGIFRPPAPPIASSIA